MESYKWITPLIKKPFSSKTTKFHPKEPNKDSSLKEPNQIYSNPSKFKVTKRKEYALIGKSKNQFKRAKSYRSNNLEIGYLAT